MRLTHLASPDPDPAPEGRVLDHIDAAAAAAHTALTWLTQAMRAAGQSVPPEVQAVDSWTSRVRHQVRLDRLTIAGPRTFTTGPAATARTGRAAGGRPCLSALAAGPGRGRRPGVSR
jgi:hypothetical protein